MALEVEVDLYTITRDVQSVTVDMYGRQCVVLGVVVRVCYWENVHLKAVCVWCWQSVLD